MPTLLIRFPANRYHATPWGHHVNEGMIEWPPSPWRLLRSLLAIGYSSGLWNVDGPPSIAQSLIKKLASCFPGYILPQASGAHSRHYMPLDTNDGQGLPDRTMVFDTWAQVEENGILAVTWDVALSEDETAMLAALVERLGYLGRSESWIEARLLSVGDALPSGRHCFASQEPPPPGWEQVSLLAAQTAEDYRNWRVAAVEQAVVALTATLAEKNKKPSKKQKEKAQEPYPPDLLACLQQDTSWWRKYGWSQPPGSQRVLYRRPATALESGAPKPVRRISKAQAVCAMLMSMATKSGNNHVLPPFTRVLPQGELLHAAISGYVNRRGLFAPLLLGRDEERCPLKGRHEHTHILHLDLDGDGHLDHVLIWTPAGLDGSAQEAVRAVRQTYTKGGLEPIRLAVVGSGDLEDLRNLPGGYGIRLGNVLGPVGGAKNWTSLTPFVAPRYLKKNGRNTLCGQVISELTSRGFPMPVDIRVLDPRDRPELLRHRHFIRKRRKGPPPADFAYSLALKFDEPVSGPLCLGYGGHFGLGVFAADEAN